MQKCLYNWQNYRADQWTVCPKFLTGLIKGVRVADIKCGNILDFN